MSASNCAGNAVTVVGLGLMGGSAAKAVRGFSVDGVSESPIYGIDRDFSVLSAAVTDGAVDESAAGGDLARKFLSRSGLVVICLYPGAAVKFLEDHADAIPQDCVVTDMCGIKTSVVYPAQRLVNYFVGGHPMAGREQSGYFASLPSLFKNCNYVLTPTDESDEKAAALVERFALHLGAARLVRTTPERHDRMIAYTSQMAHVIASCVANMPELFDSRGYEGGSFGDITRVATLNAAMWSELFTSNADALSTVLGELVSNLTELKSAVDTRDVEAVSDILVHSTVRKERYMAWKS